MIVALTLALVASTSAGSPANPAVARSNDPPIQVWLNSDNSFVRGERAKVYIRAAEDGYVVVLRADAEGHVRVLFPLDPNADAFARGDRKFEVRSRGDREAFTVDDGEGTGLVLAAWSATPFAFDGLVRGDHWDLSALGAQQTAADSERNNAVREGSDTDREAALVAVVQAMAGDNHFDYDVATYTVHSVTAYDGGPYYGGPYYRPWYGPRYGGLSLSIGFGNHWRYGRVGFGTFCDGFYWSAWGCGPFYDPFFYPVVYRPYGYRPYGFGFSGSYRQPFTGYTRASYGYAEPRVRIPSGGSFSSGISRGFARVHTGTRSFAPAPRSFRDGGVAQPQTGARSNLARWGERGRGSAPVARSAPSGGSSRGSWGSAAPRSSGPGYSRSGGGYSRSGGGGGGGGGGRRH
jgi:hypothetical protein